MTRKSEMKPPKVLFFHEGKMPSAADYEECLEYGANVQYRAAQHVRSGDVVEDCDGVAGVVPDAYDHLPSAEDALESFRARIKAALGGADEEKAPRAKKGQEGGAKPEQPKTEGGAAPAWPGSAT